MDRASGKRGVGRWEGGRKEGKLSFGPGVECQSCCQTLDPHFSHLRKWDKDLPFLGGLTTKSHGTVSELLI